MRDRRGSFPSFRGSHEKFWLEIVEKGKEDVLLLLISHLDDFFVHYFLRYKLGAVRVNHVDVYMEAMAPFSSSSRLASGVASSAVQKGRDACSFLLLFLMTCVFLGHRDLHGESGARELGKIFLLPPNTHRTEQKSLSHHRWWDFSQWYRSQKPRRGDENQSHCTIRVQFHPAEDEVQMRFKCPLVFRFRLSIRQSDTARALSTTPPCPHCGSAVEIQPTWPCCGLWSGCLQTD